MKKFGFIFMIISSLFLSACQVKDSKQSDDVGRVQETIEEGLEKSEPTIELPVTDEEWLTFYKESNWSGLEIIEGAEYQQPLMVDFEGDSIPEVVLLYSVKGQGNVFVDTDFGFLIGIFDQKKMEWNVKQQVEIASDNQVSVEVVGKLIGEDGMEALALQKLLPGAVGAWYKIDLYRLSKDDSKVIRSASHIADVDKEISINNETNSLLFSDQGKNYEFTFGGENWLVSDTNRMYMYSTSDFYKESFMELIGENAIKSFPVKIADNYDDSKARYRDSITLEDYYMGGICAQIDDFFFCSNDSTDEIVAIVVSPTTKKNIHDYEKLLGFPDDGGVIEMDGPYYVWTYQLGEITIDLATDTEDPESDIVEMNIRQTNYYESTEGD